MKKDRLDRLFDDLEGQFDVKSPRLGHQMRFLEKLEAPLEHQNVPIYQIFNWQKVVAVAAVLVLCISVFMFVENQPKTLDLASVSPELSETQDFFTVTLETELKRLDSERSPLTEKIINDALEQIEILEAEYQKLKYDLTESGKDQRVIYAMISNFQNRIDILQTVLDQIETIKQLKYNTNETTNTI